MFNIVRKAFLLLALAYAQLAGAQAQAEGMTAMQLKNWDQAIRIYSAITQANGADQNAWLTLGNAYLAKGDKEKAKSAFQSAFNAKPDGPLAHVANARILLLQNNMSEADNQITRAKKNGKKDINVHRQVGESFLFLVPAGSNRPNHARAIELLNMALDVNSKDFETRMALAFAYKEQPNGGLAVQQYELAAQLEPKNPLPVMMLAKAYKTAKLPQKFEENIERAIAINPKYVPALRERALHYYYDRQWAKALEGYRALIGTNSPDVTIDDETQLANLLYINKQCAEAITLIDKIIAKDGSKNYLRRVSAYCNYDAKEYQKGLDLLNEYFKTAPADKIIARDYEYLGRLQLATAGDTTTAIGNLLKSVDIDSSNWEVYAEIARLQYTLKNPCGAAENYQIYVDSLASDVTTDEPKATDYYYLGFYQLYCRTDSLRYVKAEASFARVTEMNPKAPIGWQYRAQAAQGLDPNPNDFATNPALEKEFGKAKEFYEKYIEVASPDPVKNKKGLIDAYSYLYYYYFLQGNDAERNRYLDEVLKLDPTNPSAMEFREAIKSGSKAIAPTPGSGGGQRNK